MGAHMEKSRDLGSDVRDSGQAAYLITHNKGKEPVIPADVDTPTDDELSSGSSPSLSLSPIKNARDSPKAKSRKRPLRHYAFNNVVSGVSSKVRRETSRRQNQPIQVPGNTLVLPKGAMPPTLPASTMQSVPLVHPTFGKGPMFCMSPTASIRRPNDMLSSPLGQHILDYESPRWFVIPVFATFDGFTDLYDHLIYYN